MTMNLLSLMLLHETSYAVIVIEYSVYELPVARDDVTSIKSYIAQVQLQQHERHLLCFPNFHRLRL